MIFAGLPPTIAYGGTFFTTTLSDAITAPSPIISGLSGFAHFKKQPRPIQTSLPIFISHPSAFGRNALIFSSLIPFVNMDADELINL